MWKHHRTWYARRYLCPESLVHLDNIRKDIANGSKYSKRHREYVNGKRRIRERVQSHEDVWLDEVFSRSHDPDAYHGQENFPQPVPDYYAILKHRESLYRGTEIDDGSIGYLKRLGWPSSIAEYDEILHNVVPSETRDDDSD